MTALALLLLAQPAGPAFEVHTTAKPPAAGPLALPPDLVSLRRPGQPRPPWPRGPHLVLANGDRLVATVVGGDGRAVWVRTAYTGGNATDRLAVPFAAVAAVWLQPPPADTPPDPGRYPWAAGPKRADAVLLADGDVRRGVVGGLTADPVGVRLGKGGPLPADRVLAVAFDPSLGRMKPVAGRHVRAVLLDGSRLTFATAAVEGDALAGTLAAGPAVRVPADQLLAADVVGGPVTDLAAVKPVRQEVVGYAGAGWPWQANRTVKGLPLRVGADTFDTGIGTHPRTVLAYRLDGRYRRFEATVGLDPLTGQGGTAAVRLVADGNEVTPAGLRELSTTPVPVAVGVSGVKELTLEVGFGSFGDVRADVNWGGAKLIE